MNEVKPINTVTVGKELHPEVLAFKKKLFNYDHSRVLSILLKNQSCKKRKGSLDEVFLQMNETATTIDFDIELFSDLERYREVVKKQKLAEEKRKKQRIIDDICYRFNNDSRNWEQDFRHRYEVNPVFSKVKHKRKILIAVVDTGINFKNDLFRNAIPSKYLKDIKQLNFSGASDYDTHGHGNHVAGIILGIMPKAKILPLKYYNPKASGDENLESSVSALKFAIDENVDMINYSGGGPEASTAERLVLEEARKKGIIVVVAAGNENSNIDSVRNAYYPASYKLDNIVVVANQNNDTTNLELSRSSNFGNQTVDFITRGEKVYSTSEQCSPMRMTGTSQSTPVLTSLIATYKAQYPDATLKQIINHISKTAVKEPDHFYSKYGFIELSSVLSEPFDGINSVRFIATDTQKPALKER